MFEASGSIKRENHLDKAFEKNAPVKKIIDLGTPSSGSPSTIDAYERMFSTIPKCARFGKLFKNVDPRTCEEKKNIDCVDDGIQPIETNQKSMTKDGDITSLLKLLRKNNDEDARKLAAKTLFDRQMLEDYFIG
ncbi:uncharacterized protein LOC114915837 [Cajanus cajan]|uniref:uncharacterized protein LOC114915837 n=1 Tax=Cajanus cajan TaxID=3821 RepID=UPI0010FB1016|nr:uncharacterized protein LOC114915837 [Cajanus cajan]